MSTTDMAPQLEAEDLAQWDQADVEASDVRCPDAAAATLMIGEIDAAKAAGKEHAALARLGILPT